MLDKTYRPEEVETRLYEAWERSGAFAADPASGKRPYTIMMPPPNVTGSLHIGHALTFTLQDILVRFERMRRRDVLWQPGTDHAGIGTEIVVGNQLAEMQINKQQLGRDAFVERVWAWKAESGGTITRQLRRLGASADWRRERFTMDEGLSAAVRRVFVTLYREGLIYRDKRLVNWDPVMHTVISDLEVESRETKGSLWHIRYPVEGEEGRFIVVATTRPETMLGDTGVAVHPDDMRYADLVGRMARLPLVGRLIPIVADEYADPDKGSGAVKITPAHDFNDFEVGKRHNLEAINIFDRDAQLNDAVPEQYRGLDRFAARKAVVADLEAAGLIARIEDQLLMVPHHGRSGEIVEPWLTDQWFCNAAELVKPAIDAVRDKSKPRNERTEFIPKQWENTFFEWMDNIQPWCISRQLWWGHRIPAWYGPDGHIFVAESADEAAREAAEHYRWPVALSRDEDVLDTWFSSALWPFSTLGWPDETPELARYYPSDVLVTGFDIIFFWVARMIMQGLHFKGEVPFRTVYIHALVRDERGQKMSKSKGNIIDPLELIDRYGCDALRFTLAALASPGRDIALAESRVEGGRNFATKLWNAARYAEMSGCALVPGFDPSASQEFMNRWIADATAECVVAVTTALETFRFDEAGQLLYHFVWGTFCDWYLEFTKPILQSGEVSAQAETRATAAWVLGKIVHLLHPVMPFITEEIWSHFAGENAGLLIAAQWPTLSPASDAPLRLLEMRLVTDLISAIRAARAEMNVPPAARVPLIGSLHGAAFQQRDQIERLARVDVRDAGDSAAAERRGIQVVVHGETFVLAIADIIDLPREKARLSKEIGRVDGDLKKFVARLGNSGFRAKAEREIIEELEQRVEGIRRHRDRLQAAYDRIAAG
jgi:valyl-tRNA synthetase